MIMEWVVFYHIVQHVTTICAWIVMVQPVIVRVSHYRIIVTVMEWLQIVLVTVMEKPHWVAVIIPSVVVVMVMHLIVLH